MNANDIKAMFAVAGGALGVFLGGIDALMYALITFIVADYLTGVTVAIIRKQLNSEIGFKGIAKKVFIFLLVGIAHTLDVKVLGGSAALRTAVIFFYIANEGISLLENIGKTGLPIPSALEKVLAQLKDESEED